MKNKVQLLIVLLSMLFGQLNAQQAGDIDRSFNYGRGSNYPFNYGGGSYVGLEEASIQTDGKILIGGNFRSFNGFARNHVTRLNADGGTDMGFNPSGTGADTTVSTIVTQPDGKILIGGSFKYYNGVARNRIARLNSDGSLDNSFNPGLGADSTVHKITLQSDGKILIGGVFTNYNGSNRNHIARINSDGSLDNSFNQGTGANAIIQSIALQANGKILIGGAFTSYNGSARDRIARLNTDGSLDNSFNTGTVANAAVLSIALQSDGKILLGGNFGYLINGINGTLTSGIVRLNSDGSLDNNFNPGRGGSSILSMIPQTDGKILIGGSFQAFNGIARNSIARLNADGSLDSSFNIGNGANDWIYSVLLQSDGKVIIGGAFDSFNGTRKRSIARLNTDGSLDNTFNPSTGSDGIVAPVTIQTDGKILLGGDFTSYNGVSRKNIARLNSDGGLDASFNPGTGANSLIQSIAIQTDGKILIGGDFTSYNGIARNRIARLNSDGSLDNSFNPVLGADSTLAKIALQSDGKILIAGDFRRFNGTTRNHIARLNADGSLDQSFNLTGTGADSSVSSITLQSDGKILIGGSFSHYNGTGKNKIARLNSDGSLDNSFNTSIGRAGLIFQVVLQTDGKILIGGEFTLNTGATISHLARLNSDGSLDASFNPGTVTSTDRYNRAYLYSIGIQSDSKILIGGSFTSYNGIARDLLARLNSDGSIDNSFNPVGTGFNYLVFSISIQLDGKILIGGYFSGYNNLSTPSICRILSVAGTNPIAVKQDKSSLSIYPNPATSQFTIQVTSPTTVQVLNALGQVVITQKVEGTSEISTAGLALGMYTIIAEGYKASSLVVSK